MGALRFRHSSQGPFRKVQNEIHSQQNTSWVAINLTEYVNHHLQEAEEESVNSHIVNPKE